MAQYLPTSIFTIFIPLRSVQLANETVAVEPIMVADLVSAFS
jgi:hypothetical protein